MRYGPLCHRAEELAGTGTITVDAADGSSVRGSVDLRFWDGSTAAGTFAATLCPVPQNVPDQTCLP